MRAASALRGGVQQRVEPKVSTIRNVAVYIPVTIVIVSGETTESIREHYCFRNAKIASDLGFIVFQVATK